MNDDEIIRREFLAPWLWIVAGVALAFALVPWLDGGEPTPEIPLWTVDANGASSARIERLATSPEHLRVAIERTGGPDPWSLFLARRVSLEAGREYVISFTARSDRPRKLIVVLNQFHPPWAELGFYQELALTAEPKPFRFVYRAPRSEPNARLRFAAGGDATSFDIIDPRIEPIPSARP